MSLVALGALALAIGLAPAQSQAGVFIGFGVPVYPGPYYYGPPVVYGAPIAYPPPPAAAPQPSLAPQPQQWYYCSSPAGYYPYVQNCASGWQAVPATPPRGAQ
ncbi:MAG: hypothetical protein WDN69_32845 [Aliidongia sp.]